MKVNILLNNFFVVQKHDELNVLFNKEAHGCSVISKFSLSFSQEAVIFSKELFTSGKKPEVPRSSFWQLFRRRKESGFPHWDSLGCLFREDANRLIQYLKHARKSKKPNTQMRANNKQTLKAASVSSIKITFNAQSSLTLGGGANTAASIRLVALPRVCGRALPTRLKAEKWSTRTETELESTWHWSPRESRPWSATFFHSDGWPAEQRQQS